MSTRHLDQAHHRAAFELSRGDEAILRPLANGGTLKAWRLFPAIPWRFELREKDTHRMSEVGERELGYLTRRGFVHGRVVDADHMEYVITDAGREALAR